MATKLSDVIEGEGKLYSVSFKDDAGASVAPNNITYTLRNERDKVVNSRSGVVVSPATSVTIQATTADCDPADGLKRFVTVNWDYDSTSGTGIKKVSEAYWNIQNRESE